MTELFTASKAKVYFEEIVKKMQNIKIKAVFSASPFFSSNMGYRRYEDDAPIYVLFENDECLIIDYCFIDSLYIDFRPLNSEENVSLKKPMIKDFFNCSVDIHRWDKNDKGETIVGAVDHTEIISLEYEAITEIDLRPVTKEYSKWIDGNLDYASPNKETFDQIKFTMSNGNTFVVCADDAEVDGYVMVWSTDAEESIIQYD